MTNNEFEIWLSGYVDLEDESAILTTKQLWIIHNHLQLTQTISIELNEKNKWLQARINELHTQKLASFRPDKFKLITAQIRKWCQKI